MEEVDMDGSESDQELTGNETDESEWASKVHEHWLIDTVRISVYCFPNLKRLQYFFTENVCKITLDHYLVLIALSSFLIRIIHFKIHVNKIFILKTFGCKKKSKSTKNKQNKWINNFENLNSSKHLSVKDMRVRGDIQYNV
jgi:hypothetical protein